MLFVILLASFVVIGASSAAEINDDISVDNVAATNIVTDEIDSVGTGADDGVVEVDNEADLKSAINNDSVKEIKITKDITLSESLNVPVSHSYLKIDGQNHKFSASANFVAQKSGGALYWDGVNGYLTNCVFSGFNSPNIENGGAICWNNSYGSITNCNFVNCAAKNGGAIYYAHNNGLIKNCKFTNNVAKKEGNSIYIEGLGVTVDGCKFSQTHKDYSECEIYVYGTCEDINIINNVMLTKAPMQGYAAVHLDDLGYAYGWAYVAFDNNKFKDNCIFTTGSITSPIKAVFDSKVVKKGENAVIRATIYDDNGNYIVVGYRFGASIDDKKYDYVGELHGLHYYFIIPTKDLKPGVYKLYSDLDDINPTTDEGTLTVLANNDTNKTNPIHKGIPMEHTGNPLVVLLIGLATVSLGSLKRKL